MVTEDLINSLLFRLTKNSDLSYKNLSNTKDGCLFLKRLIPLLKLPSKFAPSDALIHNLVCTLGYFYTALSGKKVKRSYDPITKRDSGGFYNFVHLVLAEHPYFGKMLKTKNLAGIIRKYCEKRHAS